MNCRFRSVISMKYLFKKSTPCDVFWFNDRLNLGYLLFKQKPKFQNRGTKKRKKKSHSKTNHLKRGTSSWRSTTLASHSCLASTALWTKKSPFGIVHFMCTQKKGRVLYLYWTELVSYFYLYLLPYNDAYPVLCSYSSLQRNDHCTLPIILEFLLEVSQRLFSQILLRFSRCFFLGLSESHRIVSCQRCHGVTANLACRWISCSHFQFNRKEKTFKRKRKRYTNTVNSNKIETL